MATSFTTGKSGIIAVVDNDDVDFFAKHIFDKLNLFQQRLSFDIEKDENEKKLQWARIVQWEGAHIHGPTKIKSGPDYGNYSTSFHIYVRQETKEVTNIISTFLGVYRLKKYATIALEEFSTIILHAKAIRLEIKHASMNVLKRFIKAFNEDVILKFKAYRSLEELLLGLRPCSCGKTLSTLRCSKCLIQFYCCKEHQKEDWKNGKHKLICTTEAANRNNAKELTHKLKKELECCQWINSHILHHTDIEKLVDVSPECTILLQTFFRTSRLAYKRKSSQMLSVVLKMLSTLIFTSPRLMMSVTYTRKAGDITAEEFWTAGMKYGKFKQSIVKLLWCDDDEKNMFWKPHNDANEYPCTLRYILFLFLIGPPEPVADARADADADATSAILTRLRFIEAQRCYDLLVETDGAFCACVKSILTHVKRAYINPNVSNANKKIYEQELATSLWAIVNSLVVNAAVMPKIVKKKRINDVVINALKEIISLVPKGPHMESICMSIYVLVSAIEVWCEKADAHPNIFHRLGLQGRIKEKYMWVRDNKTRLSIQKGRLMMNFLCKTPCPMDY